MAFKFPSDEWIKELARQLNASEAYEKSAKDWEGDFIFVVEARTRHTPTPPISSWASTTARAPTPR